MVTRGTPTAPGALAAALIAARKQCTPTVHKAGANQAQGYKYVGHEHVLVGGARDALLDNGLVLLLESYELVGADTYKTSGGEKLVWRWRGRFLLLHTSGEQLSLSYEATTVTNDKAGFVASTALDRTAHMRVLELAGSDEENPEHDSHEAPAARARKAKTKDAADPPRPAAWWREKHNGLCDMAFKKANIASGAADEFGLHVPTLPVPVFSGDAKNHPGLRYDHKDVKPGFLREVIWKDKDFGNQPAAVKLWVSYLVARHELRKIEDAAAEAALGQGGAA
jgi:hypothetical protein